MADGDYSQEIERLDSEWDSNPSPIICAHLADLLRQSGRLDEALDMATIGLKRWQKNISVSIVLGKCYRDSGLLEKALDVFGFVHEAQPQNLVALLNLAEIYYQKKQWNKTISYLEDYLFEHPGDEEARELLETARSKKNASLDAIFSEDAEDAEDVEGTQDSEVDEDVFPQTERMARVLESQEASSAADTDKSTEKDSARIQTKDATPSGSSNSSPGSLLEYFTEEEKDALELKPYDRGNE